MSKFRETCGRCKHVKRYRVGDSFDRADAWICGITNKEIDGYRDAKEPDPDIPDWCPLPDIK